MNCDRVLKSCFSFLHSGSENVAFDLLKQFLPWLQILGVISLWKFMKNMTVPVHRFEEEAMWFVCSVFSAYFS
jgi:hypothetical protein